MAQTDKETDEIYGDVSKNPIDGLIPASQWCSDVCVNQEKVKQNLLEVQRDIVPYTVKIIAVTKYYGCDAIIAAYNAGLRNFGESRAIESIKKIESLPEDIRKNSKFHFIGHLQSNKAEKVVRYFDVIHSIDSLKIASIVSQIDCGFNKREKVLLQINNSCEKQKSGYTKDLLENDFRKIIELPGVEVVGLMNMAPIDANEEILKKLFKDMREYRNFLENKFSVKLPELSMGMSNDYKLAVKEGATAIRIGRKLFK